MLLVCLTAVLLAQHVSGAAAAAAPAAAASRELPTQASKPTIIAIGDGLTEGAFSRKHDGWGLLMQERYVRKVGLMVCG
jgi:lysophospholipase L1-like esterase